MKNISIEEFKQNIETGSTFVVDFYADWCEACKNMLPVVEEVSSEFSDIPFFKVNIDEQPELKEHVKIKAIPMLMIYSEGRMRGFVYGNSTKNNIERKIQMAVQ